ncbi:hypothetical protein [Cellulomonas sp. S1-8]|uniref:hypothetical protein n=1 Tax=Cellulomonas sp. S1-8 TaxID=2904790 RepID=UPI002244412C|nr:hypothetical protein [Cellulomonas sp. S1-8]UZN02155.1 hypothetical protein OKX07_13800 [Cellulomonas sp. S1-8]
MTRMFVNTKVRMQKAIEARIGDREAGQGMLEYIGILVVAALLIVAVLAAFDVFDPEAIADTQIGDIDEALQNARD